MELYHGTNKHNAKKIKKGNIDVNIGGGELGRGFYTGDLPHEAFNWAWHKYKTDKSVVKFNIDDDVLLGLNPLCLNKKETLQKRASIRRKGLTKTYLFSRNIVWAPVVGKEAPNFNQLKFESHSSQKLINKDTVAKTII